MWPFKKKVTLEDHKKAIRDLELTIENLADEPKWDVCDRCGKTDFKDNMEKKEEAYKKLECTLKKGAFTPICVVAACNVCPRMETVAKLKTYYQHKNCRKPK